MTRRILPVFLLTTAICLGGCQSTATGKPGENGWSGLVNPNKARDLATAAAHAVRKSGSIIAGNLTPAEDTHHKAAAEAAEPDDPYITACTVEQGTTSFAQGWMDFARAEFTIRKGEEKNISLIPKKRGTSNTVQMSRPHQRRPRAHTAGVNAGFWVTREKDGQNLVFCAEDPAHALNAGPAIRSTSDCIKIVAMEDYLSHGIKRTLDIPGAVRGGTIACGYEKPQFAEKSD